MASEGHSKLTTASSYTLSAEFYLDEVIMKTFRDLSKSLPWTTSLHKAKLAEQARIQFNEQGRHSHVDASL